MAKHLKILKAGSFVGKKMLKILKKTYKHITM